MLAKSAALEHEITHGAPFAPAFQIALNMRKEGSAAADNYHQALKAYYPKVAQGLAFEIEKNLEVYASTQPDGSVNSQG